MATPRGTWDASRSLPRFGEGIFAPFLSPSAPHAPAEYKTKHTAAGYREQESEEGQAASIVAPAIGQAGLLILL